MKLSFINYNKRPSRMVEATITFIIPTICRSTLDRSLLSLKNQTNPNWNAIVVFDGITPTITNDDDRIKFLRIEKTGNNTEKNGRSGHVRNEGIRDVKTEWVGFLDDDDTLTPDYVQKFQIETKSNPDVIIFRMQYSNGLILPPPNDTTFKINHVGISFCFKTSLFQVENIQFNQCGVEDFDLLDRFRQNNKNIIISKHITYLVRPDLY